MGTCWPALSASPFPRRAGRPPSSNATGASTSPAPGGRVEGRLVSGIDAAAAARIAHFESDAYELEALPVRAARRGPVRALAFMARPGVAASHEEWELASWRRRHKRTYLRLVGGWMAGSRGRGRAGGGASVFSGIGF